MPEDKPLADAYRRAGNDFLARRIEGMFRVLKTPEDVALHNSIQKEIMEMVAGEPLKFYRLIAYELLEKKMVRRTFRKIVAEAIFGAG